jgi:hypothetical protein
MFRFCFIESLYRGVPITDIACGSVKRVTQGGLLCDPFDVVSCGAATCDDFEAVFVKAVADGGTDTTHTTGNVGYFLTHAVSSFFFDLLKKILKN